MSAAEIAKAAKDEVGRAYDCWRRWHNPMSRRWFREAVMEYKLACIVAWSHDYTFSG